MARGWESKSVEAQQTESQQSAPSGPQLTTEQKINLRRREGLLLDRKRVLQQIEGASNERYRTMLQTALADLDRKIADLG